MEPELQHELKHIEELAEENNLILKQLQRSAWWTRFFQYIYWILVLAIAIGALYYLEPIFNKINQIYMALTGSHLPNFESFFGKF